MTHRPSSPTHSFAGKALVAALSALIAVLMGVLGVVTSAPAQAADAYRYWIYWDAGATGPWIFATTTADAVVPKDGTVDGWRFAIAGEPADTVRQPRIQPDFAAICANTPVAPAGQKRVALVLDFGTQADSPDGTAPAAPQVDCVTVPEKATSTQVLAATGKVRTDSGMICGIDGYPATGCGDVVPNATIPPTSEPTMPVPVVASAAASAAASTTTTSDTGSSTPWGAIVGVIVIVALGLVAFALSRRSRG